MIRSAKNKAAQVSSVSSHGAENSHQAARGRIAQCLGELERADPDLQLGTRGVNIVLEHQGAPGVVRKLGVGLFSQFQLPRFSVLHSPPRYDLAMLAADEVAEKTMVISLLFFYIYTHRHTDSPHTHTHIYIYIYVYTHRYMYVFMYICMYTHRRLHLHTYTQRYIYIYTHTHTYIYIYIYSHIQMHVDILVS